jgi:signal transduction histidine kinase
VRDRAEGDLAALANFYAAYTASTAPDEASLARLAPQIAGFFAPQADYDVRLFSARSGALLATTQELSPLPSSAALGKLALQRPLFFVTPSYDQPGRVYAVREVLAGDGTVLAVVEVSRDVSEVEAFLSTLRLVLLAAGGLTLIAALVVSLLLAREMTRPLREMETATRAIAGGDFDRRLRVGSEDEMGQLATSINHMAADLARLEAARREFIARISHDLRTPLTAIKGLVVNLQDSASDEAQSSLATMDEQADRLIRLVNDLLTLSRLQRGALRLHRDEIDVGVVAHSAVSLVSEKAKRMGVELSLDMANDLPRLMGDADRLQQVIVNLLDNALRATEAGGQVQVQVTRDDGTVTLTVLDEGRGLSREEEARAFETYFRGSGGGAGLGLTISREIVNDHGGRIWLRNRPEGGAEAGFSLPVEQAQG